jgi:hypothetical protein
MKAIPKYLILLIFIGCQSVSDILPVNSLKYLEEYHCWPYEVKVYSVDAVMIDSLFYLYPLKSYFGNDPKYKTTTWAKYSVIDTTEWFGMDKTLEECEKNFELYNEVMKGGDIYYAGRYQYFLNQQGKQNKEYETLLFLDLNNNKLHVFKDINKVF